MGKIKETLLSLGYRRKQAEELEYKLKQAGIKEPEEEEVAEIIKPIIRKTISEVKSTEGGGK